MRGIKYSKCNCRKQTKFEPFNKCHCLTINFKSCSVLAEKKYVFFNIVYLPKSFIHALLLLVNPSSCWSSKYFTCNLKIALDLYNILEKLGKEYGEECFERSERMIEN